MAKPLGVKSRVIREAIRSNPGLSDRDLAELVNNSKAAQEEGIEVRAGDIALQKVALKKLVGGKAAPAREPEAPAVRATRASSPQSASADPIDLIDKACALAKECGGMEQLKRLVERLVGME